MASSLGTEEALSTFVAPAPEERNWFRPLVLGAIGLLAFAPMLFELGRQLAFKPHYHYAALVPFGSILLGWAALVDLKSTLRPGNALITYGGLGMSAVFVTIACLMDSPLLACVAFQFFLLIGVYGVGSWTLTKALFPAWLSLWLAVPLPLQLDSSLISSLQLYITMMASAVLDLLRVEHLTSGVVIEIPSKQLMVEEACSGIHSFFATLAFTVFFVLWARRGWVHGVLLLLLAFFWVVLGNLTRVLLLTLLEEWFNYSGLTTGWPHEALSIGVFAGVCLVVISTDRLLLFLSPRQPRPAMGSSATDQAIVEKLPDLNTTWLGSLPLAAMFAVVACLQTWVVFNSQTRAVAQSELLIGVVGEDALPKEFAGCRRLGYRTIHRSEQDFLGEFSQTWIYRYKNNDLHVSLDSAYVGFHDLTVCYRNNGWTMTDQQLGPDGQGGTLIEATFEKPNLGEHAYLLFSVLRRDGTTVSPPWYNEQVSTLAFRLESAWQRLTGQAKSVVAEQTYQVQVFAPSYQPMSQDEKDELRESFLELRNRVQQLASERLVSSREETGFDLRQEP